MNDLSLEKNMGFLLCSLGWFFFFLIKDYGLVGEALGIDLINNPELVATDPVISFKTAIWFWMARHENKPSFHDVIINANSEASHIPNHGVHGNSGQECSLDVVNRSIGYYKRYCDMLEVSYGDNLKYRYDGTPNFSDGSRIRMPLFWVWHWPKKKKKNGGSMWKMEW